MSPDERIVVLGGEAPPPRQPERAGRRWVPLLAVAGVAGVVLVALLGSPSPPDVSTDPAGLAVPPDPTVAAADAGPAAPIGVPSLATGWRTVELMSGGGSVNGLAYGADGWLAVTEGDAVVAHTSDDGVTWRGQTLPDLDGFLARAAVGDGVMAVVMSRGGAGAISTDRGDTWTFARVDDRVARIDDVVVLDGVPFAFGAVADEEHRAPSPAVWRWDGATWTSHQSTDGVGGFVGAVAAAPDGGARAFGTADGRVAAWDVVDGGLAPVAVEIPAPWTAINEVLPDLDGRFIGLGGDGDALTGRALLFSEDLVTWTQLSADVSLMDIAVGPGGTVVASSSSSGQPWSMDVDGGSVWLSGGGVATGREQMTWVEQVASSQTVTVLSGYDDAGRSILAVRGVDASPRWRIDLVERSWSVVATADAGAGSRVPRVANSDETTLLHTGSTVWELAWLEDETPGLQAWVDARASGAWPDGVWARTGTHLELVTGGSASTVGFEGRLLAIGEISDELTALGGDEIGSTWLLRLTGNRWEPTRELVDEFVLAVPLRSGFVGSTGGGPRSTFASVDGEEWTVIDGDLQGVDSGVPFVAVDDRIVLLDRWPETQEVTVPTRVVRTVLRHGDGFVLHSPGSVWVGSPDAGWRRIPAGLQDGVPASTVLVPGEVPTLASVVGRDLVLLQP